MVPTDVDNLLVAGRCVSGDKVSHAAMRNMMACTVTGQVKDIDTDSREIFKSFVNKYDLKPYLNYWVNTKW